MSVIEKHEDREREQEEELNNKLHHLALCCPVGLSLCPSFETTCRSLINEYRLIIIGGLSIGTSLLIN